MSYQQLNQGLTVTFVNETGLGNDILKGKEVTTRRLRKSNITAFRKVFNTKEDIKKLAKLACHSESVQEQYYDFSSKAMEIVETHQMLNQARQQETSDQHPHIEERVRSRILRDFTSICVTDFDLLHSDIGGVWSMATLRNRAEHWIEQYSL